eukprot:g14473.t1
MCVSLLPSDIGDIYAGIRRNIYQFLMRYNESLGGVLLAVSELSFGDGARDGRIEDEMPHIHFDVKAKAQVFCPRPGHVLEGRVNKVTSTHVGLLVCGIFNASVASESLGEGFRFDLTNRQWRRVGLDAGGESGVIAVGDDLKFIVTRMHEAAGLISMEGSLEGLQKEGEGRKGGAESAVANPSKRRAAAATKSSPEAMQEGEGFGAAVAAKAARKKAKKAAKLAAKAGKKIKTEL